jgi:hypothetical protein
VREAYRYALDLIPTQQRLVAAHAGVARFAYNWVKAVLDQRAAERPYDIPDAGFAETRRQLAYKTGWDGGRLLVTDRWCPSSKTCSARGAARAKLTLSEREYSCGVCGLVLDRDHNAARNLAALAAECDTAGSGPVAARGADRKTRIRGQVAVKREPGTASAGKTRTVPPQGRTTDRVHTKAHRAVTVT